MNKILILSIVISWFLFPSSIFATDYTNSQFSTVVSFMHDKWLTKYTVVKDFRPDDLITRQEASKFFTQAYNNIFSKSGVNFNNCTFTDTANADSSLATYITQSCKLWIFKWNNWTFSPFKNLSNAEAITVLVRIVYGFVPENTDSWYWGYYDTIDQIAGTDADLKQIINTMREPGQSAKRWDIALLIYYLYGKSKNNWTTNEPISNTSANTCDVPQVQLDCALDFSSCPSECKSSTQTNITANNEVVEEISVLPSGENPQGWVAAYGTEKLVLAFKLKWMKGNTLESLDFKITNYDWLLNDIDLDIVDIGAWARTALNRNKVLQSFDVHISNFKVWWISWEHQDEVTLWVVATIKGAVDDDFAISLTKINGESVNNIEGNTFTFKTITPTLTINRLPLDTTTAPYNSRDFVIWKFSGKYEGGNWPAILQSLPVSIIGSISTDDIENLRISYNGNTYRNWNGINLEIDEWEEVEFEALADFMWTWWDTIGIKLSRGQFDFGSITEVNMAWDLLDNTANNISDLWEGYYVTLIP